MRPLKSHWRALAAAAVAIAIISAVALIFMRTFTPGIAARDPHASRQHGPWIYGSPSARFTIIEYADFECPYCRGYFLVLRHWIDEHPEVNWQWRNLPLPMHEPAATREALLAECAGEVDGNRAFWRAVAWIYHNTGGNGAGFPTGTQLPEMSRAIRGCLTSPLPSNVIRLQAAEAAREHIVGTPTLRLVDRKTDRALVLQGSIEGDALLSAVDSLALQPARPATREDNSR